MAPAGMGEELEKAMSGQERAGEPGVSKKILILSFLSQRPCSTVGQISRNFKISARGVLWHIGGMKKEQIISEINDIKIRYFISGSIRASDCGIFTILSDDRARAILHAIAREPGVTQKEIAVNLGISRELTGKIIKKLIKNNLVGSIRDGKNRRYFITKRIGEMEKEYSERRKAVKDVLEGIMKELGVEFSPDVERDGALYLRIGDEELKFSTDPLKSSLEG